MKLANLRVRPQVTVTFRNGWQWAAVEGRAELAGPDDPRPWLDAEGLRLLRRAVFTAAGGEHDDWAEYDRVMAGQRRAVVLIRAGPGVQQLVHAGAGHHCKPPSWAVTGPSASSKAASIARSARPSADGIRCA